MKKRVAVLISGNGSNLQALIDASLVTNSPYSIELVISNKLEAFGLIRAKKAGIKTAILSHKDFADRKLYDQQINKILEENNIEIVCLAGFMRILSKEFVHIWRGKIINIHPSMLPEFKGAHAIVEAFNAKVEYTGVTVHHVTEEMDAGEVILQEKLKIEKGESLESLTERIHKLEHQLYPKALKKILGAD